MKHVVKNYAALATDRRRRDALAVLEAGLRAIDTRAAMREAVSREGRMLTVRGRRFDLSRFGRTFVIGIGKAAYEAAAALEGILGERLTDGIVLDVKAGKLKRLKSIAGSHPLPSPANVRATGEIIGLVKSLRPDDLLIVIASGGGSALLCWPHALTCDQVSMLTAALMREGADIHETNTVRKHVSEILGGQLAALAAPATVLGLVFSDVPGDDISQVASGPTVLDQTTIDDARRIMDRYDPLKACKLPACELRETPKDPALFQRVTNVLILGNRTALAAMEEEGERRGYVVRVHGTAVSGEARQVGATLAGLPQPGEMVIAGGETTVTVRGSGRGGRNQELALGALSHVPDDGLVLSCASDGIDNGPVAGAFADATVRDAARKKKLDPDAFLARNDSSSFFKKAGGQIMTGHTGSNVSDLMIALRRKG
ncbi:DUF4147 domain-containing protein [Patescibacteria group bacterium]|nr:MAG: DUF4147 domain-containing protein [Patescibacteria group bacterium]